MITRKKNPKMQIVAHGGYSSVANCRTKISTIFRGVYGIFAVLKNFYLFVLRYLAEPLPMFRGTLIRKHWSTDTLTRLFDQGS